MSLRPHAIPPLLQTALWLAFSTSLLGDQVARIALTWHVWDLDRDTTHVALLAVAYGAPLVAGGLVAGPLIDRFGAVRVMLFDNVLRGAFMLAGAWVAARGGLSLGAACALAAVYGFLAMITIAGIPVLIAEAFDEAGRMRANAREMIAYNVAGVAGPALGTALSANFGVGAALALDAVSYFLLAAVLLRLRAGGARRPAEEPRGMVAALGVIAREPILRNITLMFLAFNVGFAVLMVMLPEAATRSPIPGLTPAQTFTAWVTVIAAGEIISALLLRPVAGQALGVRICAAQVAAGLTMAVLAFAAPIAATLALFAVGMIAGPLTVWAQTLRMAVIPADLRGRVFALLRLAMQSGTPLGSALAGLAAATSGHGLVVLLAAASVAVPGALGFASGALRRARARDQGAE